MNEQIIEKLARKDIYAFLKFINEEEFGKDAKRDFLAYWAPLSLKYGIPGRYPFSAFCLRRVEIGYVEPLFKEGPVEFCKIGRMRYAKVDATYFTFVWPFLELPECFDVYIFGALFFFIIGRKGVSLYDWKSSSSYGCSDCSRCLSEVSANGGYYSGM